MQATVQDKVLVITGAGSENRRGHRGESLPERRRRTGPELLSLVVGTDRHGHGLSDTEMLYAFKQFSVRRNETPMSALPSAVQILSGSCGQASPDF